LKLQPIHRARRFFASLLPYRSDPAEDQWVNKWLSASEQKLFSRVQGQDRRHAIGVARAVEDHENDQSTGELHPPTPRWVVAAALLHDIGKTVPDLGTYGRVVATMSAWVGGVDMAEHWADTTGFTRKVGLYMMYPRLGSDLLAVAGSDQKVVDWAAQHHLDEEDWTIPVESGRLLQAADDGVL